MVYVQLLYIYIQCTYTYIIAISMSYYAPLMHMKLGYIHIISHPKAKISRPKSLTCPSGEFSAARCDASTVLMYKKGEKHGKNMGKYHETTTKNWFDDVSVLLEQVLFDTILGFSTCNLVYHEGDFPVIRTYVNLFS